jgi:PAS domain-containing protein
MNRIQGRPQSRRAAAGQEPLGSDAVILLTGHATVIQCNPAAERLLGFPGGSTKELRLTDLPRYRRLLPEEVRSAIQSPPSNGTWRGQSTHAETTGEIRILEFSVTGLDRRTPGSADTLLVIRDVTPTRRAGETGTLPRPDPFPLCAHCKSVGDGRGSWQTIETYLAERSDAPFRQEMCPVCMRSLYPELCEGGRSSSLAAGTA